MLRGVDIKLKILMRKVKSLLKETTPFQICSAPFLNRSEICFKIGAEKSFEVAAQGNSFLCRVDYALEENVLTEQM